MIEADMRTWLDNASYEELLAKWRNAPAGDPFFRGELGEYYRKVMNRKRAEVGNGEHVRASKAIGWEQS